jgi:hypothetical protein
MGMSAWLDLHPGRWTLVIAPGLAEILLLDLIARLARRGPVRVVDGGNRFQAHLLARTLGRRAGASPPDLLRDLGRVQLARAFTCYQVVALLRDLAQPGRADGHLPGGDPPSEVEPPLGVPTVVLDLLATFYDESVPLAESQRLLTRVLGDLERLNRAAPLAVSARPPRGAPQRAGLLARLESAAGQVWRLQPPEPPPELRLF